LRKVLIIASFLAFVSCEFLGLEKKEESVNKPIASVFNQNLYKEDIKDLLPKNIDSKDSVVLVRSIINNWATKQLLLRKAEENNTQNDNTEINNLVRDYRQALLINGYKERLIKQQLDTVISEQEIIDYYQENSQNFRLNEELIKTRYMHFSEDLIDKKEVIKLFRKGTIEDLEELEMRQLSFKSVMLNDSTWTPLENVMLKTPFSRDNLLKKQNSSRKKIL
jgi:ribosomal protein L25 (general stress protein Ctc)